MFRAPQHQIPGVGSLNLAEELEALDGQDGGLERLNVDLLEISNQRVTRVGARALVIESLRGQPARTW